MTNLLIPQESIANKIIILRNQKIILDRHIAALYGVENRVLNQSIKRNKRRFPKDFMFQLTKTEEAYIISNLTPNTNLKSQIVTSNWGGRRKLPYAFTEQGVAMLASVLRSPEAIEMNILIIRTFVKLRELMLSNLELEKRIRQLEQGSKEQKQILSNIYSLIDRLVVQEDQPERLIGYEI